MSEPIVVGVGGNVGTTAELIARFRQARIMLAEAVCEPPDLARGRLYRTAPIGPEQPAFLNTALVLRTPAVQPREILSIVHAIERALGRDREREARWGPRTLDLDVLVWGDRVIQLHGPEGRLEVPHPRLTSRAFALAPMVDVVGSAFMIPGAGRAGELLSRVVDQPFEVIAEHW
jgi:2-amino-4-hydroxy-6-hydroxymethyldihydropteridine diphosphokinase